MRSSLKNLIFFATAAALVTACSDKAAPLQSTAGSAPSSSPSQSSTSTSAPATGAATPSTPAAQHSTPSTAPAGAAAPPPSPPVSVTTIKAQKKDLPINLKATGTVQSMANVDVRSQVTSVIKQVHFREGQFVRKGELLFTLDARADEANMAKAKAQIAKDQAALADAKRQLLRTQDLFEKKFISQAALDTAQTAVESQAAILATNQAAMDSVKVALSNSRIVAPSAGRAGAVNVFAGSAVQANITSLVTVTQLDPIDITFSLPQRHLNDALEALQGGGAEVVATLPEGAGVVTGKLRFVDNLVDASSGAVKVKATFQNATGKLWPGAFAEVSLTVKILKDVIVVPQDIVIRGARGTIVYVVQDGKAVLRPVQIVQADGPSVAITGVKPGESIVSDGKQNLRPDAKVIERPTEGGSKGRSEGGGKPDGAAKPDSAANGPPPNGK
jgi:RND family efflux transporter MFP subunit